MFRRIAFATGSTKFNLRQRLNLLALVLLLWPTLLLARFAAVNHYAAAGALHLQPRAWRVAGVACQWERRRFPLFTHVSTRTFGSKTMNNERCFPYSIVLSLPFGLPHSKA